MMAPAYTSRAMSDSTLPSSTAAPCCARAIVGIGLVTALLEGAAIGDLRVRDQHMHRFAAFGLPGHLVIGDAAAALPQAFDQALALVEVVPEVTRIELLHLLFGVAEQFADPGIVKQQPAIFIDDVERGGAMVENFTELTLVFGALRLSLA